MYHFDTCSRCIPCVARPYSWQPYRTRGPPVTKRGGAVELAVLGLLHESPMHGYELRKRVSALLGWGRVLSYGSLYPALKQMRRAGWLTEDVPPEQEDATDNAA